MTMAAMAVAGAAAYADTTISVCGSTTVQPLAEKFAEAYEQLVGGVTITVSGGGSSVGVSSAGRGTTDVGMASREIKSDELAAYPSMQVFEIARDGIAIVTHPDCPVNNLSKSQVRQIFTGDITNWEAVGGPDEDIVVVSREEGSGTRAAFEEMVMETDLITGASILQPSNGAIVTTVATTPNSIGYISFGYMNSSVKGLSINGVAPTPENARAGRYPIVRPLNMMTPGTPTAAVQGWLDFILGPEGQAIVTEEGYLAVR
jgi:phosphate transport system substrate-binding protein